MSIYQFESTLSETQRPKTHEKRSQTLRQTMQWFPDMNNTLTPKENSKKNTMEQMQLRYILSEKIHEMKLKGHNRRYIQSNNTSRTKIHQSLNFFSSSPKASQKVSFKSPIAQKQKEVLIPSYLTNDKQQAKMKAAAIHVIGQFHNNFTTESDKFKQLMTIMNQN